MDTLTDPEGRVTEFDYDARGLPVQVTWDNQYVMNQQFDALGRLTEREAPNGVVTSHEYDELSQIQEITHEKSDQTVISSFDYEYDGAGNIVSITEADSAAFEYGYDETDQLVKEVRYDDTGDTVYGRAYQYDPLGNRLVKEDLVTGDTTGYSYGADNRMLSAGDVSFSYDIGGNMVEKDDNGDTVAYEWDEGNNLSKVTLSDGTTMELEYDGDHIRASRTIDGEEVQFAWDPQNFNVLSEYDELGTEQAAYGPQIGMDDPWVMMRESGAYFYQTDHLNSVTELTDENEAVQNEYRYKAFGEALAAVEMVENEYQFTARRRDGVDGIQFNRFRHYQAKFGRWNQWDVMRYLDSSNLYLYALNNPLTYLDHLGFAAAAFPGGSTSTVGPVMDDSSDIRPLRPPCVTEPEPCEGGAPRNWAACNERCMASGEGRYPDEFATEHRVIYSPRSTTPGLDSPPGSPIDLRVLIELWCGVACFFNKCAY